MTWDDKFHKRHDEPKKVCPAPLTPTLQERLAELAVGAFRACGLLDYARVDIRLSEAGEPFVLEINSMATLGGGGSLVRAASAAGYTFRELIGRIVDISLARYSPWQRPAATATSAHGETAKLLVAGQ